MGFKRSRSSCLFFCRLCLEAPQMQKHVVKQPDVQQVVLLGVFLASGQFPILPWGGTWCRSQRWLRNTSSTKEASPKTCPSKGHVQRFVLQSSDFFSQPIFPRVLVPRGKNAGGLSRGIISASCRMFCRSSGFAPITASST